MMNSSRWQRFIQILDGMCSISLFPDPRFKISDRTPEEAIAESWEAVGETMKKVIGEFEDCKKEMSCAGSETLKTTAATAPSPTSFPTAGDWTWTAKQWSVTASA
jgi:hypothetical protein